MQKTIYSNLDRKFLMLDYNISHSQILLRNKKDKEQEFNVDIIFKGVTHLFIPTEIIGINIQLIKKEPEVSYLTKNYNFKSSKNDLIFELRDSSNNVGFVNAFCFGVYHNELEILQTSIGRYDLNNHNENIIWFSGLE